MLNETDTFSIDLFRDTLNAVHQESNGVHTLYSTIYDLKQGLIYLYYFHDFEHVVTFNLREELQKGIHSYDISSLFPVSSAAVELGGKTPAELADLRAVLRQATVNSGLLKQYEGNYQLEVLPSQLAGKISVKSENDRLFLRQPWTPWLEGIPQSNEEFIHLYSDNNAILHKVSFSFAKDGSGQVTKMEVATDGGKKTSAIKLLSNSTKVDTSFKELLRRYPIVGVALIIVLIIGLSLGALRIIKAVRILK